MQMVQPAMGYYSRKNHIQKGREWERGSGGGRGKGRLEDMEFPGFIKKKNQVEFPGVLVLGLKISEGCNTVLQSLKVKGEALFCVEFPGLK